MHMLKKLLCLTLALTLSLGLLAGCESEADKIEKISGSWTYPCDDTEEAARNLLENLDFYEEEIALADLTGLDQVYTVTFNKDKSYSFGYDVAALKQCVREYLDLTYDALYNGRSTLGNLYGVSFDDMSREEFRQFYAELYSQANYEKLLDYFAENVYDYESLAVYETGTFSISGSKILCTITGDTEAEALTYELKEDGTLVLEFADTTHYYTR